MSKEMTGYLDEYKAALDAREKKEIEKIEQMELEDVNFELAEDPDAYKMSMVLGVVSVLMAFKIAGKHIISSSYRGPSVFTYVLQILLWIAVALVIFSCFIYPIIMKKAPKSSVRGGTLYHKGKSYHYKEITMLKVSSMNRLIVYMGRKKIMTIPKSYLNFGSLIGWGRKCGITIFREPEMDANKVSLVVVLVVVLILVVATVGIVLSHI